MMLTGFAGLGYAAFRHVKREFVALDCVMFIAAIEKAGVGRSSLSQWIGQSKTFTLFVLSPGVENRRRRPASTVRFAQDTRLRRGPGQDRTA